MCAIQRVNGKDNRFMCLFECGVVVGARRTDLCQELIDRFKDYKMRRGDE